MFLLLQKAPLVLELLFNGSFILLYALKAAKKLPSSVSPELIEKLLTFGVWALPLVIFLSVVLNYISSSGIEDYLRKYVFSLIVFVPMVITWGDAEFAFLLASAHLLSTVMALYESDSNPLELPAGAAVEDSGAAIIDSDGLRSKDSKSTDKANNLPLFRRLQLRPAQAVALSFMAVILVGAFLLVLPVSANEGKSISFVDALFMATSATCVTGLATVSVANDFSLFGQLVLVALMQVGGLGIMTLTSSMTLFLGRAFEMRDRVAMQDVLDVNSQEELYALIIDIIRYTFYIELWGAIVLTFAFTFEGFEFSTAIYYGLFHSVSAFCNSGLAMFDNSLENFATRPMIHGTVAVLITLGGLGFVVLKEMRDVIVEGKSFVRISIHTRVVLVTSLFLTASGAAFIFFSEFLHAMDSYTVWQKIQVAIFQSVTLRTAGFNTIPMGNLHNYTVYVMILYMFIGASPGSTGGGIKTTTLAILFKSMKSALTGQNDVTLYDRKISPSVVVKSTALTFMSIVIVSFFVLLMLKFESDQPFLTLAFEVVSAFGTVGLSLGVTPFLSSIGKVTICIVMLIGRVGPLTLLLAIAARAQSEGKTDFPEGRVMIG